MEKMIILKKPFSSLQEKLVFVAQPFWHLLCGFLIKKTIGVIPKQNEKIFVPRRICLSFFFFLKSSEGGGTAAVCIPQEI